MSTLQIVLLSITIALTILFIVMRTIKGGLAGLITKIFASLGFVSTAIFGITTLTLSSSKIIAGLIAVGLVLGMIGDILLDLKVIYDNDKFYLNFGMLSFSLGHVAYFSAFTYLATINKTSLLLPLLIAGGSAILLTIGITFSSKKMGLDFGKFLWQTIGYTFVLTFMTAYTLVLAIVGGGTWLIFIGLVLFFLSDIVLSLQYFGGQIASKPLIIINHALYYAAQIILSMAIFYLV